MKPSARIFVLAGPSGVGKTTIARQLLRQLPRLERSISCTTRSPRPDEREGHDYFFVGRGRFRRLIRQGQFLEWARIFSHYYGTPMPYVKEKLQAGIDILLVIDVQGAAQLRRRRKRIGVPILFLFILPPSWPTLRARLADRQSETSSECAQRLQTARRELETIGRFDHLIVNRRLGVTVRKIEELIEATRVT